MFIFYGPNAVGTGYPDLIGISVNPANMYCVRTTTSVDPRKANVIAYPVKVPEGTAQWVFIPDEYTWVGMDNALNIGGMAGYKGRTLAALRPMIYYGNTHEPTNTGLTTAKTCFVKVSKHGVCFYEADYSHHVMMGYCPPDLPTSDPNWVLDTRIGVYQGDTANAGMGIMYGYPSGSGNYTMHLIGPNGSGATWETANSIPDEICNKTFAVWADTVTWYDGDTETQGPTTQKLWTYAYVLATSVREVEKGALAKNVLLDRVIQNAATDGSASSSGSYVVR